MWSGSCRRCRSSGSNEEGSAMHRRAAVKTLGLAAFVPAHNWDRYDWNTAPSVSERLYQGPFPEELVPSWDVVMATVPSSDPVPNFGAGLVTYLWDEAGQRNTGKSLERSIEDLVALPLGSLVYMRVDWRHVHKGLGRFAPDPHWRLGFEIAKAHGKRV